MFIHIVDNEIYVKLIDNNDAARLFELADKSRLHLRKWLPWLDMANSVDDTLAYVKKCRESYVLNRSLETVIVYQDEAVGMAGFNFFDWSNKSASLGYWLAEEYEGKGIMTRTVQALTEFAFFQLGMNRVEIRAAEENEKSRAIPERLGFRQEGVLREAEWLYDHFVDHAVYGTLAKEWKTTE